ncbi:Amino Acid/Auxin Permease (AAAP) Family [Achlya hypogyna]|uniref:Amino Acid/Auxin Permease (AAAP) Family n=1 Tax=Achlya hypogyna TaxID=1202772 RepID=A0A1V9YKQ0_ACHHY|nr:Amino Acid/Auxin Permease (AAAP) Family [Achlya hypogyna]
MPPKEDRKGLLPPTATPVPKHELLTTWEVTLHLLKGNIGAGALSLPYAFAKTGIYVAPIFYLGIVLICIYNMNLLLYCKNRLRPERGMSFGDVGYELLGKHGKYAVNVFLVGTQLSFCCVFFTVVATNLHAILPARLSKDFQERQLILLIFPILLGLSWIRSLHKITPYSALATFAVLLGIAIVFFYSYVYAMAAAASPAYITAFGWGRLPEFYGTAVYSFEGIGLILPLEKDMKDRNQFQPVLLRTMSFILVLFLCLGELPVLAFGTIENGSMTAVLQRYFPGWSVAIANLLLAVACLFSFPIQFYPALEVLEKLLARQGYLTPNIQAYNDVLPYRPLCATKCATVAPPPMPKWLEDLLSTSQYELRRTLFRSMLCTLLMLVAICVPNVGLLISLFGSVGSSMLAVILPPIFYLALEKGRASIVSWALHLVIVVIGIVGMIAGTIQALDDIVRTFE